MSQVLRAIAAIGLAAAIGSGCFGSAMPHFYTLSSASGAASGAPVASLPELGLAVGPLEFPRYLDRPEIVTRDGDHRLVVADAHRWGGSLGTDILRVVADDLGRLLGTARVVIYPTEPRFEARYRVLLDIREFEGVPGEKVALRVRWTIASLPDGAAVAVEESSLEQPIASTSYADLVAAQSTVLRTVTRQIAERLAALAASTPSSH
ncbi:MAG TPA: PqiC family protein [Myxococcota bacterium]|nr:PqiC family protein [Myxococcota bacterium]